VTGALLGILTTTQEHDMDLRRTHGKPFYTICIGCHQPVLAGDSAVRDAAPVYADLHGNSFKAFYCERCANTHPHSNLNTNRSTT
jgi:hypothetical protein